MHAKLNYNTETRNILTKNIERPDTRIKNGSMEKG